MGISKIIIHLLGITNSCRKLHGNPSDSCRDISDQVRQTGAVGAMKIYPNIFCTAAVYCCVNSTFFSSIVSPILEKQMPRPVKIVTIVKDPHSTPFLD